MSKKKSYMKINNIISEGFFDKLFKKLGLKDKNDQKKLVKGTTKGVDMMNKASEDLEKFWKELGYDVKFNRFKPEDFLK